MENYCKVLSKDSSGNEYSSLNLSPMGVYNYIIQPDGSSVNIIQFKPSSANCVLKIYSTLDDPFDSNSSWFDIGLDTFDEDYWNSMKIINAIDDCFSGYTGLKLEVTVLDSTSYFNLKVKGV